MTPPPINIDGTNENYSNVTIDGQDVTQITIDGQDVLSTIPDSVIDNFNDVDSDPTGPYKSGEDITTYYSGKTSIATRKTSNVAEGSHAVEIEGKNNANTFVMSTPGDGLPTYPDFGDTVSMLINDRDDVGPGLVVNAEVNDTGMVLTHFAGDKIQFRRFDGTQGSRTDLSSTNVSTNAGTWYQIEIDTPSKNGDNYEGRIYDVDASFVKSGSALATVTETDANYTDQRGVGVSTHTSNGIAVVADRIQIE